MTRAEERAMRYATNAYGMLDSDKYGPYVHGYEQAEKDLALTWEDVKLLCDCFMDTGLRSNLSARSKEFYEEVLRKFNEQRK